MKYWYVTKNVEKSVLKNKLYFYWDLLPRYYISLMDAAQNLIFITSYQIYSKLLMILFSNRWCLLKAAIFWKTMLVVIYAALLGHGVKVWPGLRDQGPWDLGPGTPQILKVGPQDLLQKSKVRPSNLSLIYSFFFWIFHLFFLIWFFFLLFLSFFKKNTKRYLLWVTEINSQH